MASKPGFAALLLDAHGVKPKEADSEGDDEAPELSMAKEMLRAIEDKDPEALAEVLAAIHEEHAAARDDRAKAPVAVALKP